MRVMGGTPYAEDLEPDCPPLHLDAVECRVDSERLFDVTRVVRLCEQFAL